MLDKNKLQNAILSLFDDESEKDVNPAQARSRQAQRLAEAIDDFVRNAEAIVTVNGTSATGGPVTATGKGYLR